MTVANLERIYPIKVYKKCRNVGKRLAIGAFSLIFIEIVLRNPGVKLTVSYTHLTLPTKRIV